MIRPIFLIAGNTVTGVLRGVVLNVLLVMAALFIVGATSSGTFEEGEIRRMLVDSGLAVITVLGAMISILTGFIMIPREVETRTIYPIISKPVQRWQFVLGKFFGAISVNAITVGLLSVLFFVVYILKVHEFDWRLLVAILMIFVMLTVLSALIVFFSTFMSWIGTIIVSMVIWVLGSYSQFLYDMAAHSEQSGLSRTTMLFVQRLLPNFQAMDLRFDIVQTGVTSFEPTRLLIPLGWAALYIVVSLLLAVLIFNRREL